MTLATPLASFSTRRQSSETKGIRTGISKLLLAVGLACGLTAGVGPHPAEAKEWKITRFGMDASYAPLGDVNQKGEIVGFGVDHAKAICVKLEATCTFQNQDWDGIIPSLLSSKFDVILSSMNITDARKAKVIFADVKLYPAQDEPNLGLASGWLDYVGCDVLVEQDFLKNKGNGCCTILSEIKRMPVLHRGLSGVGQCCGRAAKGARRRVVRRNW